MRHPNDIVASILSPSVETLVDDVREAYHSGLDAALLSNLDHLLCLWCVIAEAGDDLSRESVAHALVRVFESVEDSLGGQRSRALKALRDLGNGPVALPWDERSGLASVHLRERRASSDKAGDRDGPLEERHRKRRIGNLLADVAAELSRRESATRGRASLAERPTWTGVASRLFPHWIEPLAGSGLRVATLDFYRGIPWENLLAGSREMDLLFTYGRSWRHTLSGALETFFDRAETTTRVVLPDVVSPNNTALTEIAKRAGQSVAGLSEKIEEAIEYFTGKAAQIWVTDSALLYASYRFDDVVVASMYNHQRGKIPQGVATFVVERGGHLFEFFAQDFVALTTSDSGGTALSRRIH